ncbi:MAG: ChaN family lipoprotein [Pseudomonadota bacterium]
MKPRLALPALFAALTTVSVLPATADDCVPAVGVICYGGEAIDEAALLDRLRGADIAILGERHDNPVHHEWQARLVAALAPAGLAFEMVAEADEDIANAARDSGDDLREALNWDASGWGDWAMYAPIFDAAPDAWIAGGGVDRDMLMKAVSEGAAAAFGDRAARYRLDERFPQDVIEDMLDEQDRAHCGALPTAMLPGMSEAQQLRDAAFADAALRLLDRGQVVLITGNGHARTDRGVPFFIDRAEPDAEVISVGMIEVPEDGTSEGGQGPLPYDITVFTEPFDRGDPCEEFIKSRQKP